MTDYYPAGMSHPVITELVPGVEHSLFPQMDAVADLIRKNPTHTHEDDKFAFRQLQKMLLPDLSLDEVLDMYCLWSEHYAGHQFADDDAQAARYEALVVAREFLLRMRERFPDHHVELTAKLYEIGLELADLQPRPLGEPFEGDSQWPGSA